jgi:translation elongation factor P/translation initiation factor 5A
MNITLSADKSTIEKARAYAKKHNTSLNNLIRNYLQNIISRTNTKASSEEFERNALEYSGKSDEGYVFDRDEIYKRN